MQSVELKMFRLLRLLNLTAKNNPSEFIQCQINDILFTTNGEDIYARDNKDKDSYTLINYNLKTIQGLKDIFEPIEKIEFKQEKEEDRFRQKS